MFTEEIVHGGIIVKKLFFSTLTYSEIKGGLMFALSVISFEMVCFKGQRCPTAFAEGKIVQE